MFAFFPLVRLAYVVMVGNPPFTDSDSWTLSKALVTGENVLGCCGDEHLKRCLNDLEVSSLVGSVGETGGSITTIAVIPGKGKGIS